MLGKTDDDREFATELTKSFLLLAVSTLQILPTSLPELPVTAENALADRDEKTSDISFLVLRA